MLFQRWINGNQHISFDEFKSTLKNAQQNQNDNRSVDEILEEVKTILDGGGDEL